MSNCDLKLKAEKAGLSPTDIASILEKWGPAVLQLVIDGLTEGFTQSFIKEILDTLGPLFLTQAVNSRRTARNLAYILKSTPGCTGHEAHCCKPEQAKSIFAKMDAPIIQGQSVTDITPSPGINPVANFLVQALIQLLQSCGQQVAQTVVNLLIQILQQQQDQNPVTNFLVQALIQLLQSEGAQVAQTLVNWLIQILQQQENQATLVSALSEALTKFGK